MAKLILTNQKLWVGGYDLSGDMNAIALKAGAAALPATTFGSTTEVYAPGLKSFDMQFEGFWQAGAGLVDETLSTALALAGTVVSIGPTTGAEGEVGQTASGVLAAYEIGGAVGELVKFSVSASAQSSLVRGLVLQNATRTTTGTGTAYEFAGSPQVLTGQRLYAALHVLAISGTSSPTITVKVQSDTVGFGSPVDQITFVAATTIGAQSLSVAGPITDTYWRVVWTISGTNPSMTFVVVAGIL